MARSRKRDPSKGTEFGGTDGLVQPYPHDWRNSAAEQRMAIVQQKTQDEFDEELDPTTDHYKEQ